MAKKSPLPSDLRALILARDRHRCRWCGRTNTIGLDPHHIRYRRGVMDDVASNLISLCRLCHNFVHGERNGKGETISKQEAQEILWALVDTPGAIGMAMWRQRRSVDHELVRLPKSELPRLRR